MKFAVGDIVPETGLEILSRLTSNDAKKLKQGDAVVFIDESIKNKKQEIAKGEVFKFLKFDAKNYLMLIRRKDGKTEVCQSYRFAQLPNNLIE